MRLHELPPIRAVTFDAGGTLLEPSPSVGVVYAQAARAAGFGSFPPDELEMRFRRAWSARGVFNYSHSSWATLVQTVFEGLTPSAADARLFSAIWRRFSEPDAWHIYPDVRPCLTALNSSGIRMAVLSNWDERLHGILNSIGLSSAFEFVLPSVEGPAPKPDSRLFRLASLRLGLPPQSILHVGDGWQEDFEGARFAGFQARWLHRGDTAAAEREPDLIRTLAELPQQIVTG